MLNTDGAAKAGKLSTTNAYIAEWYGLY
jgi:hypothetical protein